MEIYAPLADRIGMHNVRDELEDLSFKVLNFEARKLILNRLDSIFPNTQKTFTKISNEIDKLLQDNKIEAVITGREKSCFSIWKKIQSKRISLEQVTDIIGFRIILNNNDFCYKALGIFHQNWKTIMGRFKDYISTPKSNYYSSLHTTVIGPLNQRIEIQIRTYQMHDFAERGVASHWIYKINEKVDLLAKKAANLN